MLEQLIVTIAMNLAISLTGYAPLPADYKLPEVEFVSGGFLREKACELTDPEKREKCFEYYKDAQLNALYDRFNPKIYVLYKHEKGLRARNSYEIGILMHEYIHVLQMHWKHHDDPHAVTPAAMQENEIEAHAAQRRFMRSIIN